MQNLDSSQITDCPFKTSPTPQTASTVSLLQLDLNQVRILADEALRDVLGLLSPRDSPGRIQSTLDK